MIHVRLCCYLLIGYGSGFKFQIKINQRQKTKVTRQKSKRNEDP